MIFGEKFANLCRRLKKKTYALCCGTALVIILTALFLTFDFGCNVIVNGEVIGVAPSKEFALNLKDSINGELAPYLGGLDAIDVDIAVTPKIAFRGAFLDEQTLGEKLKSYCPYLEEAYTVKSNGKTVAAFKSADERKNAYNKFLKEVSGSSENYEILDTVAFEYELVPYGLIKSGSSAYKMLMRTYEFSDTVELGTKSDLQSVLCEYAICEDDFLKLNPKYKEGKTSRVKIESEIPYIRVLNKESYTQSTLIKHSVKYELDDTMYEGVSAIKVDGKNGFDSVKKTRYEINGMEICRVTGKKTHEDSVTEVILMGTKPPAKGKSSGTIDAPCTSGVLTSRFGSRGGRTHKGIDISGAENSAIKAADGGVVVYADWDDSGYGNVVKIEHQSGYTTLYAHCNDLYVKKGDRVNQGDVIASLGNTGRSTGPHIHFEVIVTSSSIPVDPLKFFDIAKLN